MAAVYDLKTGYPNMQLVPRERLSAITAEVLAAGKGWQYGGDLLGLLSAREQISRFLSDASGQSVAPDELMITAGALTAIDIVSRTFTQPGDVIVVEDPTFYFVVGVLRMSHCEVVSVPLGADGIDLNALDALCKRYGERLKLVYSIPSFQNPTGITATHANRTALVELAKQRNFIVVEDSTYQLLYYDDAPPPPYLKTYDRDGHVILVGSVSKLVMPGLRTGWIWAQAEQIQKCKAYKDDAGSALTMEIIAEMIRSGAMTEQVDFARKLYAGKHNRAVAALARSAPDWLQWSAPGGGFFIWMTLPPPLTATKLDPFVQERGVKIFAGRESYVNPPDDQHLRLCFALLDDDLLDEGIARLSEALNVAMKSARA